MNRLIWVLMIWLSMSIFNIGDAQSFSQKMEPIGFAQVEIRDGFWSPRLETNANATIRTCIAQMRDSTRRISNFEKAAGLKPGNHEGIYFDDSDVYKAMEGIAYSLINNPNPEYEVLLDNWINLIAKSQQPDGYLNTYYTLNHPEQRWTDIGKHEMYCGGHMIEAAIAHQQATGKNNFLKVAIKFADHLDKTFGPGKRHWVPGHQEIELALVKLYHVTKNQKYLDLAHWLLEERGRAFTELNYGVNIQNDVPVSEITDIKGHAVRAMYMFSGMADVVAEKSIPEYVDALERVWEKLVFRNMYLTGGIGSSKSNEGFTTDYDLPNKTAYCETCASIGMVFWNSRMNLLSGEARYADVMERSLYNGVLSGVSLDGDLFFYVNPLESDGDHHRQRWFGCACCPSNIARFIPSVGNYIYMTGNDKLFVNLYMGNETDVKISGTTISLVQKTNYPWEGKVQLEVNPSKPIDCAVNLRIPGWCKSYMITVNGDRITTTKMENGYLNISRRWIKGDKLILDLDMPVELVSANMHVIENTGKRAVQRGPLVYCIEKTDNKNLNFENVTIEENITFSLSPGEGKLKEMVVLRAKAKGADLTFIPYFAWDNREAGKMRVWIDYKEQMSLYK